MNLRHPAVGFVLAGALFALCAVASIQITALIGGPVWVGEAVVKTLMLLVALAAMRVDGGAWADYGVRWPVIPWRKASIVPGLACGAAATASLLLMRSGGISGLKDYSLPALIIWVWLYSSFAEEVFCRGWLQGFLREWQSRTVMVGSIRLSIPVLTAGLLFGAMHASLLVRGTAPVTVALLVCWTTLLGLIAGHLRARSGSLLPAFAVHIAFNVGGTLAGIVYAIVYRLATGKLPVPA